MDKKSKGTFPNFYIYMEAIENKLCFSDTLDI